MVRIALRVGALSGLLAVLSGAFGAHSLKAHVSPEQLSIWQTAVFYQSIHALALLFCGFWSKVSGDSLSVSILAFIAGILLFSGSLYILVLSGITALGVITPIGGVMFLIGWWALCVRLS